MEINFTANELGNSKNSQVHSEVAWKKWGKLNDLMRSQLQRDIKPFRNHSVLRGESHNNPASNEASSPDEDQERLPTDCILIQMLHTSADTAEVLKTLQSKDFRRRISQELEMLLFSWKFLKDEHYGGGWHQVLLKPWTHSYFVAQALNLLPWWWKQ